MVLSPFNEVLDPLIQFEAFFHLFQHFLAALAADGVGDEKRGFLSLLDSHELPAPGANDFYEHGFTSFLRA
jgi:hypothetical protein